jgi:hypothetical protein
MGRVILVPASWPCPQYRPHTPKPIKWNIYKIAANAVRLGTVEAPDSATA